MSQPVRTVFFGTAPFAAVILEALARSSAAQIVLVVSQPDKPKGRNLAALPTPVKAKAGELGLPLESPIKARDPAFLDALRTLAPELIVVAAYGQILPQALLDIPKYGCLNVHGSVLPKYRGAAPIQRAILEGETETGVTIMRMDAGLDTGAMLSVAATKILPEDDSQTLHDRLAELGGKLLVDTIPGYLEGKIQPQPQPPAGATYAAKIRKEDGLIQWAQPARQIWNQIRAFTPWPGSFTYHTTAGKRGLLKIWRARTVAGRGEPGQVLAAEKGNMVVACGEEALQVLVLQKEGGKKLAAQDFLAGHSLPVGLKLG